MASLPRFRIGLTGKRNARPVFTRDFTKVEAAVERMTSWSISIPRTIAAHVASLVKGRPEEQRFVIFVAAWNACINRSRPGPFPFTHDYTGYLIAVRKDCEEISAAALKAHQLWIERVGTRNVHPEP
jgi:hypothetical protein